MAVKDLLRSLPGGGQISVLWQIIAFNGSASFWERRYAGGGWSGPGSYGELGQEKAKFLNHFVQERRIESVIEFGCGDGNQLSFADYPRYVGLDVSKHAINRCVRRFADDHRKSFFLYDGSCFVDHQHLLSADLALSLDVVFHLTEDSVYESYMRHLFAAGSRYVIVYSTNGIIRDNLPHVMHRSFSPWVEANCPEWRLEGVIDGPGSGPGRADFYVYGRRDVDSMTTASAYAPRQAATSNLT